MRYVKYVGPSHVRQITVNDWRSVGLNGDTVQWSAFNGFAVPLDNFTEDQIRKGIDPDPFLVITGEGDDQDEEFTPAPQRMDMTPAQVEQAANNPVDVLALVNGATDVSTTRSGSSTTPGGRGDVSDEDVAPDTKKSGTR